MRNTKVERAYAYGQARNTKRQFPNQPVRHIRHLLRTGVGYDYETTFIRDHR
jgi:hypothetical protein